MKIKNIVINISKTPLEGLKEKDGEVSQEIKQMSIEMENWNEINKKNIERIHPRRATVD